MKCSARSELRWPAATPHQSAIRIQVPHARSGMMRGRAQMPRWLAPAWWMPLATPRRGRWWRANTSHNLMAGSWGGGAQAMFCPCKRAAHLSWIREVGLKSSAVQTTRFYYSTGLGPWTATIQTVRFLENENQFLRFSGKMATGGEPSVFPGKQGEHSRTWDGSHGTTRSQCTVEFLDSATFENCSDFLPSERSNSDAITNILAPCEG